MKTNSSKKRYLSQRVVVSLCIFFSLSAFATDKTPELPAKENFHLFLLAGQSNMAGRGKVSAQDKVPHPRVLMLSKEGEWIPAVDPVHYDKHLAGVGPGRTFALELVRQDESVVIGLIPTACGGSSITKWVPGSYHEQTKSNPYDDAMARTHRAMTAGILVGVLWHQGEADAAGGSRSKEYKERLKALIQTFRTEFKNPDLPFVIGQLGNFPARPWGGGRVMVDCAQRDVAEEVGHAGFVSSDGLGCKSDNVHFNAESQREFGRRYAQTYLEVIKETSSISK